MTEYQALRRAGLAACKEFRSLMTAATEIHQRCLCRGQAKHARYWKASARDWTRRLLVEQQLLVALRRGGPIRWRQTVLELRPEQTDSLLRDLGVEVAPAVWKH